MSLSEQSINVITRPVPPNKIRKRPGKAGMEFSYITPDFVIETLNEAFNFDWSTNLVYQNIHDNVVVVGLALSVPTEKGDRVVKQQFGSCEVTRGLGFGEAFKGAASDALKKCATLFGLGLELYQADEAPGGPPAPPSFRPPPSPSKAPAAAPKPRSPASPGLPRRPDNARVGVSSGQHLLPPRETRTTPPRPTDVGKKQVSKPNPFANNGRAVSVPKPVAPLVSPTSPPRDNPFTNNAAASSGPNVMQINAMTNLAQRKSMTPVELISKAGVVDDTGHAIQTFEELSREQAIQVIKAAQQ